MILYIVLGAQGGGQVIIVLVLLAIFFVLLPYISKKKGVIGISMNGPNNKHVKDFENKMNSRGFTKRVVAYDFLTILPKSKADKNDHQHLVTIGIWLNYQRKLVALRPDKDSWNEIEIPFDKIQSVEMTEDGYTVISGGAIGYGGFAGGSAKSKEISKGLQIRIVIGDINSGISVHIIKLYEPTFITQKIDKSTDYYKGLQECARSIVNELEFIILKS